MTLYAIIVESLGFILVLLIIIILLLSGSWFGSWFFNSVFLKEKLNFLVNEKSTFLFILILFTFFLFCLLVLLYFYTIFILYIFDPEQIGLALTFISVFVLFTSKHILVYKLYIFSMYLLGLIWFYVIYIYKENLNNIKIVFIIFVLISFILLIYNIFIYDFFLNKAYAMFNFNNKKGFSNIDIQTLINLNKISSNQIINKNLLFEAINNPLVVQSDNNEVIFCFKDKNSLYNLLYQKNLNFKGNMIGSSLIEIAYQKSELIKINDLECFCLMGRLK